MKSNRFLEAPGWGEIRFLTFKQNEASFWHAIMQQKLIVCLLGRRWHVAEIEWETKGGFVAGIALKNIQEIHR